jgi:hypothetical protein
MLRALILFPALALSLVACGDKDECTTGNNTCEGDVLMECVDGAWEESEDCAASEMICHDMGEGDESHCMMEGDMEM